MTTSFTRTRNQIAQRVLGKVLKIGAQSAQTADYDTCYEALDLRLKEMHKLGLFWRKVTSVPVTFSLASGVNSASAGGGDILFPLKMTFSDGNNDLPVRIVGAREYAAIVDKTRAGSPERALWKGGSEFLFFPVPDANGTAKLLYEKIADDTSAGAAVDVDVAMIRPLIDIIKYDVADDYGISEATQARWLKEMMQGLVDIKKLGQPRVAYERVAVDEFDSSTARNSDYGLGGGMVTTEELDFFISEG